VSLFNFGSLQELAEDIESELNIYSLSWSNLKSLRHIEADFITEAKAHDRDAMHYDKLRQRIQKKHEECAGFITSEDCLFSKELKRRLLKEFDEFKKWIEQYNKKTVTAMEERADDAFLKLAGEEKKLLAQDVVPRPRRSAGFNALILPLVEELMLAGFSKKESCEVTDRILKVLFPFYWPDVDEYSFNRVRQRYEYWLKKKR
jgi:hypothetical protein